MNYGELKRRVLELVFSYSVAGTEIPATYNNQADYIGMIPGLVNRAQNEIGTTVKRLYESISVSELQYTEIHGKMRYRLPDDCWLPLTSGLLFDRPGYRRRRFFHYRILGGKYMELPPNMAEDLTLEYWRYPERLSNDADDETELDNTPDVHECIVYYVAAYLLQYDDSYRSAELLKEYEKRKAQLLEPVWVEIGSIENLYQECRYE